MATGEAKQETKYPNSSPTHPIQSTRLSAAPTQIILEKHV